MFGTTISNMEYNIRLRESYIVAIQFFLRLKKKNHTSLYEAVINHNLETNLKPCFRSLNHRQIWEVRTIQFNSIHSLTINKQRYEFLSSNVFQFLLRNCALRFLLDPDVSIVHLRNCKLFWFFECWIEFLSCYSFSGGKRCRIIWAEI